MLLKDDYTTDLLFTSFLWLVCKKGSYSISPHSYTHTRVSRKCTFSWLLLLVTFYSMLRVSLYRFYLPRLCHKNTRKPFIPVATTLTSSYAVGPVFVWDRKSLPRSRIRISKTIYITSHAVRSLLPHVPQSQHEALGAQTYTTISIFNLLPGSLPGHPLESTDILHGVVCMYAILMI